jgi:hypothetical protein
MTEKTDYLQVDPPILGQNWVCLSFISPEQLIKKRDLFYLSHFLYQEVNKTLKSQALHVAKEMNSCVRSAFEREIEKLKSSENTEDNLLVPHLEAIHKDLIVDEDTFANKCMHNYTQDYEEINDRFKIFEAENCNELDKMFDAENNYKCSIRGVKVRGVFDERKQAEEHCKMLREKMEPVHIYVAPVGYWCPWDPNPDAIQDTEYSVPMLNELMGKYHENVKDKNKFFEERKQHMIQDAQLSNREKMKQRLRQKLAERKAKQNQ